MRLLLVAILFALSAHAAEPFPHWDGAETIEQYAKRANLPATKTLDLGDGVKLELVLIPAGKFIMGTPEPPPVDEEGFRSKILTGQVVLTVGGGVLLVLLGVVLVRAIRKRQRPQYSLAWFLFMTVAAGIGLMGGLHWYFSTRAFAQAKSEYEAAMARFKSSPDCEKPAHDVTLSAPYYLGKFEITQEEYERVMGNNPSSFMGARNPVENVPWNDAQEFCRKLSERTGREVRLPTEAEWENACRGGTQTRYSFGDEDGDLYRFGNYCDKSNRDGLTWQDKAHDDGQDKAAPVGSYKPNGFGVYDMHGNAWEWCGDWYAEYVKGAQRDPTGEADGVARVLRGGSWYNTPRYCRSAFRLRSAPGDRGLNLGFRVVVVARTP